MKEKFYCEALAQAYMMEMKGKEFYEEALKRVKDAFAKEALKFLISEEERHLDKINRFNGYLFGREEFDLEAECSVATTKRARVAIGQFVGQKLKKQLDQAGTDIEIYEAALNFEKDGYEYYSKLAEKEVDPRLRRFFEFLENEEIKHFELIQETIRYLKDPDYYFEEMGGWIFG
jgi:rubrerythrin